MSGSRKRTFCSPEEQAAFIDASVTAGTYASDSEAVCAGLEKRDAILEHWLKHDVSDTHDGVLRGEHPAHDISDVFARLRALHEQSLKL